ncbi:hypothetical protein [Alteromonas phage ZP6]|uniref:DUF6378 domain-containing protein n=1 Tax=Alteromonas phage ZP6 TaxID=2492447 RepID=A0A3S9U870_9CAUD|nr:hypothetical protein PQC03_gp19 [Alteromonas phage ZP6]AZS06522.1 hypothetical protein [Alteromonas phage ZP6]
MSEKLDSEKTTDEILTERGAQYGNNWDTYANIRRALKTNEPMHYSNCQRYCLDMIAMKLSRLVDGNANNADTWADIAGYAKLAQNNLPKN